MAMRFFRRAFTKGVYAGECRRHHCSYRKASQKAISEYFPWKGPGDAGGPSALTCAVDLLLDFCHVLSLLLIFSRANRYHVDNMMAHLLVSLLHFFALKQNPTLSLLFSFKVDSSTAG